MLDKLFSLEFRVVLDVSPTFAALAEKLLERAAGPIDPPPKKKVEAGPIDPPPGK